MEAKINNRLVVAAARSLVGVKFAHLGRDVRSGIDCVGVILLSFSSNGVELKSPEVYAPNAHTDAITPAISSFAAQVDPDDAAPADIAILHAGGKNKIPVHLGLLTDRGLIHAYRELGRVVEHSFSGAFKRRLHSIWRVPCVDFDPAFKVS